MTTRRFRVSIRAVNVGVCTAIAFAAQGRLVR